MKTRFTLYRLIRGQVRVSQHRIEPRFPMVNRSRHYTHRPRLVFDNATTPPTITHEDDARDLLAAGVDLPPFFWLVDDDRKTWQLCRSDPKAENVVFLTEPLPYEVTP